MYLRWLIVLFGIALVASAILAMQKAVKDEIALNTADTPSTTTLPKTIETILPGETHCLDPDLKVHLALASDLQSRTKDMVVYDTNSTSLGPLAPDGTRAIKMNYALQDGAGNLRRGRAVGTLKEADCSNTIISFGR